MTLKEITKKYPDRVLRLNGPNADAAFARTDWFCQPIGFNITRYGGSIGYRKQAKKITLASDIWGEYVMLDHRDRNSWNNTIENLRPCSYSQNNANATKRKNTTSKFRGVCYGTKNKAWLSHIRISGKKKYIGTFRNEIDAAKAYNEWAVKIHGEFANLNAITQN